MVVRGARVFVVPPARLDVAVEQLLKLIHFASSVVYNEPEGFKNTKKPISR
jgi:hypothetical protein